MEIERNKWLRLHADAPTGQQWFTIDVLNDTCDRLERCERQIRLLTARGPQRAKFDVETLKQIPIDTIIEVGRNNFFKMRDERTPSCYWYKNQNRFWDFGDNTGGSVIDLVMRLYDCSFVEACKRLSHQ